MSTHPNMSFNFQKENKVFSIFMLLIFFVSMINLDADLSSFIKENGFVAQTYL